MPEGDLSEMSITGKGGDNNEVEKKRRRDVYTLLNDTPQVKEKEKVRTNYLII